MCIKHCELRRSQAVFGFGKCEEMSALILSIDVVDVVLLYVLRLDIFSHIGIPGQ